MLLFGGVGLGLLLGTAFLRVFRGAENLRGSGLLSSENALVGQFAPGFELISISGKKVKLSDYVGFPVVLNFWATWCDPCRAEMPVLEEFYQKFNSKMVILAVNVDEEEPQVRSFVDQYGLSFPILLDSGGVIARQYRVFGMPTTFFLDQQGKIQIIHTGALSEKTLERYLQKIGIKND